MATTLCDPHSIALRAGWSIQSPRNLEAGRRIASQPSAWSTRNYFHDFTALLHQKLRLSGVIKKHFKTKTDFNMVIQYCPYNEFIFYKLEERQKKKTAFIRLNVEIKSNQLNLIKRTHCKKIGSARMTYTDTPGVRREIWRHRSRWKDQTYKHGDILHKWSNPCAGISWQEEEGGKVGEMNKQMRSRKFKSGVLNSRPAVVFCAARAY